MGVTLVSASMCHNFTVFSIIIGVQGFFSGIHSVGKETAKEGGDKKHEMYKATFSGRLFMTYLHRTGGVERGALSPLPGLATDDFHIGFETQSCCEHTL